MTVDVGSFIDLRSEDAAGKLSTFARSVCHRTPVVGSHESERVGCPEALDAAPTPNQVMVLIEVALDKLSDPVHVEDGPKGHDFSQVPAAPGDDHDLSWFLVVCPAES